MTEKLKIEDKVEIAADAAISINAYLQELNIKLVKKEIDNALSICTDTEEMIVEMLKAVGSKTKLGEDVVMQLIHDEFGTPDQFVRLYTNEQDINADSDSKILIKRSREKKINKIKFRGVFPFITENIWSIVKYIFVISPIFLISINFILPIAAGFDILIIFYFYLSEMIIFSMSAALLQVLQELISGKTGKLILTKSNTIKTRSIFKGLVLSQIIFTISVIGYIYNFRSTRFYTELDEYGNEHIYSEDIVKEYYIYDRLFNNIMMFIFISIIFAVIIPEIIIILRDHASGFYPLEPNFKHSIRFFTPPYILLMISIYFGINSSYESVFGYVAILFSSLSYLIARINKQRISTRFKILLFTSIFLGFGYTDEWEYLFIFILIFILVNLLFRLKIYRLTFLSKLVKGIKNKYRKYYEQKDFY